MEQDPYRHAADERCPDAIMEVLEERSMHDPVARAILDTIRRGIPWETVLADGLRHLLEGRERLMGELEDVMLRRPRPIQFTSD